MENVFIEQIERVNAEDVMQAFGSVDRAQISIGVEDYKSTLDGATNVLMVEGLGHGANRVGDAINDAIAKGKQMVGDRDLFTATKVLLYLVYADNGPLKISEIECLTDFFGRFGDDVEAIWGVGTALLEAPSTAAVRIMLANVK